MGELRHFEPSAGDQARKFKTYIENPALTNTRSPSKGLTPTLSPRCTCRRLQRFSSSSRSTRASQEQSPWQATDLAPSSKSFTCRTRWKIRITTHCATSGRAGVQLADLNKLRSDDKRVKEVTNLGLEYNLMTAYKASLRSSLVRNDSGESASVNGLCRFRRCLDMAVGMRVQAALAGRQKPECLALKCNGFRRICCASSFRSLWKCLWPQLLR